MWFSIFVLWGRGLPQCDEAGCTVNFVLRRQLSVGLFPCLPFAVVCVMTTLVPHDATSWPHLAPTRAATITVSVNWAENTADMNNDGKLNS